MLIVWLPCPMVLELPNQICKPIRAVRSAALTSPRWLLMIFLITAVGIGSLVWLRTYLARVEREEALRLSEHGYFADAEAKLKRALERNANDAEVVRALALGYCSAGRDAEGELYLRKWCSLQQGQVEPHQRRMDCLERLSKLTEAAGEGEQVLELEPHNSQLQKRVIILYIKQGRYADVERLCRRFLQGQPEHPGLIYFLAEAYHGQGRNDEAAALLDPLIPAQPNFAAPPMLRAILYCEANDDAKAIAPLRHVLELDPSNKTAHYYLAQALARTGQAIEAERERDMYLRLDAFERLMTDMDLQPGNLDLQVRGAAELLKRGRTAEGMQLLRKVLASDPRHQTARKLMLEQ